MLDQLAGLVKRGKLSVDVDLQAGRVPAGPGWTLQVIGSPKAKLVAEADEGRVDCVDIDVTGGELLVNGRGLRPRLSIEGMRFEQGKGVTEARFRGRGIWRPIVAVFRTLARPALRRLDVPTDIGSILRGEIVSSEKSAGAPNTEFLELVREVHINDTEFEAFAGYPLDSVGWSSWRLLRIPVTGNRFAQRSTRGLSGRRGALNRRNLKSMAESTVRSRTARSPSSEAAALSPTASSKTAHSAFTLRQKMVSSRLRSPPAHLVSTSLPASFTGPAARRSASGRRRALLFEICGSGRTGVTPEQSMRRCSGK